MSMKNATERTEPRGVWVYAVTSHKPAVGLDELTGVAGELPRAITAAGLTAVAGDVGLAEFGEGALRRNLEDLDWLAATARAHHRVINAVARQGPAVPMRLATVYRDDGKVGAVLAERGADFRAALERTAEREEWGVKAYAARPAAPAAAGPASSGAAYLQRRRQELSERQDSRRAATASAEQIHAALSALAAGTRLHPPQSPQLTGNSAPMILNAAYLLDSGQGQQFVEGVSDLAERHPAVRLEVTGPWPPYSFAALEADGQPEP
jgi:Gas vesicle synthesis protein GvpL/GvpF